MKSANDQVQKDRKDPQKRGGYVHRSDPGILWLEQSSLTIFSFLLALMHSPPLSSTLYYFVHLVTLVKPPWQLLKKLFPEEPCSGSMRFPQQS